MCKDWKRYLIAVAALALGLVSVPALAHCDFLTGGGFIITTASGTHPPAKANFGAGGGCKHGQPWGHLEYHDHFNGLNVHWLTITGYFEVTTDGAENDPKRTGSRIVCGRARTNLYGDVDFLFFAADNGEPGVDDEFVLRLRKAGATMYTTEGDADRTLGGNGPGGGNIQLHKPNPSTSEGFAGSCAAAGPAAS
jgi:hypothetical protein